MPGDIEWRGITRAVYADGRVPRCSIIFLRKQEDGWYDEIRYDSHDRTRGRFRPAPHFHMKLKSAFKEDTPRAEAEIQDIIEMALQRIESVAAQR